VIFLTLKTDTVINFKNRSTTNFFWGALIVLLAALISEGVDYWQADSQPVTYQLSAHQDPSAIIPQIDPDKVDTDEDEIPDSTDWLLFYQVTIPSVKAQPGRPDVFYDDHAIRSKQIRVAGYPKESKIFNTYITDEDLKHGIEWTGLAWFQPASWKN